MTEKRKSWRWPIIIVAMLFIHVAAMVTAIVIATGDRSFAVTPNYYQKAVNWDQTKAMAQASTRLGWKAQIHVSPTSDAMNQRQITVDLCDSTGEIIVPDSGELRLFHYSHGNEILSIKLQPRDGKLVGGAPLRHEGFYEFQLTVNKGEQTFVETTTQHVDRAQRSTQ